MPHEEGLYGTPDYEMEIEIDDFDYNLVAPSWSLMRSDEMSRLSRQTATSSISTVGWRLMDFMMLERQKYEVLPESVTDDMYYDETTLSEMPTGVVASNPILMAYSNRYPVSSMDRRSGSKSVQQGCQCSSRLGQCGLPPYYRPGSLPAQI